MQKARRLCDAGKRNGVGVYLCGFRSKLPATQHWRADLRTDELNVLVYRRASHVHSPLGRLHGLQ